MISPIKNSNKVWREKKEKLILDKARQRADQEKQRADQERKKKNFVLKVVIPSVVAVTVISVIVILHLPHSNKFVHTSEIPIDMSVNPLNNVIYVVNYGSNTVSVIDGNLNKVLVTILVGKNPEVVDVNPSTNVAYVANRANNTVSVIDGKTNSVTRTINVGANPDGLSVNPSKRK